jgi:hypothetical protein
MTDTSMMWESSGDSYTSYIYDILLTYLFNIIN